MYDADEIARKVRVCIANFRSPVRRPAGMGNTGVCRQLFSLNLLNELCHTRYGARSMKSAGIDRRNAAGVISAILESTKPFEQNGNNISIACCRNNSTHISLA